jgi:hypothetical protein
MLNMLLAIIVDSYEHMKETVGDRAPPAWTDLMDLVKQSYKIAKYKKQIRDGKGCLSHEQLLERFDELMHTKAVESDIKSQEEREKDVLMLNIDGYEVDRSNLTRIFAAHIAKDERSGTNPEEILGREHIDPLVDTLLKHFGTTRRGCSRGRSGRQPSPHHRSHCLRGQLRYVS